MANVYYRGLNHIFTDRNTNSGYVRIKSGLNETLDLEKISINDRIHYVKDHNDFPSPVNGVITLEDYHTYIITRDVDLNGGRIQAGINNVVDGTSSENSSLTSTGLANGTALITGSYTILFRNITIKDVDTLFDLDAVGNSGAIDWIYFNIVNVPNIGTIKDYDNVIINISAWLNSSNLLFTGSFGTIAFSDTLLTNFRNTVLLNLDSNCTITRRIRFNQCSFVVTGTGVFLDVDSATIPNQGVIITACNFSGGTSTFITSITETSNVASWIQNVGIINSRSVGAFYLSGSILTTIALANTWYKIAGTTNANPLNTKFSHTSDRLTYDGNIATIFTYTYSASISGTNANVIEIGVSKNGSDPDTDTVSVQTIDSGGKITNQTNSGVISLELNDYVELWVRNLTAGNDITSTQLNLVLTSSVG